jgi:hypothetical protein
MTRQSDRCIISTTETTLPFRYHGMRRRYLLLSFNV